MLQSDLPDFVHQAVTEAAERYDTRPSEILGGCRYPNVVRARHWVIIRLASRPSQPSSGQIGEWLGMDGSSVRCAILKAREEAK